MVGWQSSTLVQAHPSPLRLTFEWSERHCIGVPNKGTDRAGVLQGTLDVMILQTLATLGPSHGYAIAARIAQVSGGDVHLNMGTLYPGLMRLEQKGFLRGTWGVTENNRKARFYAVTPAGRRHLAAERREWDRMVAIMQALLSETN
jgi:PadR family transcriptional regulator PadR